MPLGRFKLQKLSEYREIKSSEKFSREYPICKRINRINKYDIEQIRFLFDNHEEIKEEETSHFNRCYGKIVGFKVMINFNKRSKLCNLCAETQEQVEKTHNRILDILIGS